MDSYVTETALTQSTIYKSFNGNAEFTSIITKAIKTGTILTEKHLEEQLIQIRKLRISPLYDQILDTFNDGRIRLIYAEHSKIPAAFPFFTLKIAGKIYTYVFMNNYGTMKSDPKLGDDEYFDIPAKNLYALMEGAYVSEMINLRPEPITRNYSLMKICGQVYTNMLMRIFNRDLALSMDPDSYYKIYFVVSKFFFDIVWESPNKDINYSYALGLLDKSFSSLATISRINEEYDAFGVTSLDKLMEFLKTISPRMSSISLRLFVEHYMNTYKTDALFGLEVLPYFLFIIQTTLTGSFIVRQELVMDILKNVKGIRNYYLELNKSL